MKKMYRYSFLLNLNGFIVFFFVPFGGLVGN